MLPTEAGDTGGPLARNLPFTAACAVVAMLVLALAVGANLKRACTLADTPYLPICADAPSEPAEIEAQLRERIALNPGDAWAWTRMLTASGNPEEGVAAAASAVAPNHPNVLRWRALRAFQTGEHAKGVEVLVQMVDKRDSVEAARLLARIALDREGVALLRPYLADGERWLPAVLAQFAGLNLPAGAALPLVAAALEAGGLPEDARRSYMRLLKSSGQWLDAYGLWLAYHKEVVPLLYNAGFDQPLEADGFDWEFTPVARSRAGVTVSQSMVARRGLVLELEFTGRRFAPPILRQHVFAPAGTYRLAGEYASKLRSDSGLVWNIGCGSKDVLGSSPALQDTGGAWRRFQVEFTVPAQCGPVVTLQLMPGAAFEASAGLRGQVSLDAFSLARTAP